MEDEGVPATPPPELDEAMRPEFNEAVCPEFNEAIRALTKRLEERDAGASSPVKEKTKLQSVSIKKVSEKIQETVGEVHHKMVELRPTLTKTASLFGINLDMYHRETSRFGGSSALNRARRAVGKALCTRSFDAFTGLVIVSNTVSVGIEQSYRIDKKDLATFRILENIFLVIYCTELGMRFFAHGKKCLRDGWVKFDACLVAFSIVTDWLLPFVPSGPDEEVSPVMVLRMARLARLARALRLLIKFRELWMLVHGFMSSVNMMFYTMVLLGIILYVFSSVGMELITLKYSDKDLHPDLPYEFETIINTYFPNLPLTMLSLVQFVCMDSIGAIYRPLITHDPSLALYFVLVILTVGIVLMNIITAVLVNGALEQASQDKEAIRIQEEKRKKKLMASLREMFHRLDEDGSGEVDKHEITNASPVDRALLFEFSKDVGSDVIEIFDALDIDGGGSLDIEEFCEGLYQAAVSKVPVELKRIDKRVNLVCRILAESGKTQDTLRDLIYQMRADLRRMQEASPNSKNQPHNSSRLSGLAGDVPAEVARMAAGDEGQGSSPTSAVDSGIVDTPPQPRLPHAAEALSCDHLIVEESADAGSPPLGEQKQPIRSRLFDAAFGTGLTLDGIKPTWGPSAQPVLPPAPHPMMHGEVVPEPTALLPMRDLGPMPADTPSWALEVLQEIRRLRTSQRGVSVHQTVTVTDGRSCDDGSSRGGPWPSPARESSRGQASWRVGMDEDKGSPWEVIQRALEGTKGEIEKALEVTAVSMLRESSTNGHHPRPNHINGSYVEPAYVSCAENTAVDGPSEKPHSRAIGLRQSVRAQRPPSPCLTWKPSDKLPTDQFSPEAQSLPTTVLILDSCSPPRLGKPGNEKLLPLTRAGPRGPAAKAIETSAHPMTGPTPDSPLPCFHPPKT